MKRVVLHVTEATEIVFHIGQPGAATMTQREEDTPLPTRPIPPVPPKRLSPCQQRILVTIARADERMIGERIADALAKGGYRYSVSTVEKALADMVRAGLLDTNSHAKPPGYGILSDDADE